MVVKWFPVETLWEPTSFFFFIIMGERERGDLVLRILLTRIIFILLSQRVLHILAHFFLALYINGLGLVIEKKKATVFKG